MKRIRIFFIKRALKREYLAYRRLLDQMPCGMSLAGHVSPRIARAQKRCTDLAKKLGALDPTAVLPSSF